MEFPFSQFGSAVPAASPSVRVGKEKAWRLRKHWSAVATTLGWHQHCPSHKYKAQHHVDWHEES